MAHMGMSKSVMWRPEDTGSQFSLSTVGSGELIQVIKAGGVKSSFTCWAILAQVRIFKTIEVDRNGKNEDIQRNFKSKTSFVIKQYMEEIRDNKDFTFIWKSGLKVMN